MISISASKVSIIDESMIMFHGELSGGMLWRNGHSDKSLDRCTPNFTDILSQNIPKLAWVLLVLNKPRCLVLTQ